MTGDAPEPLPFIRLRPAVQRLADATGSCTSGIFSCDYSAQCDGVILKRLTREGQILVTTVHLT